MKDFNPKGLEGKFKAKLGTLVVLDKIDPKSSRKSIRVAGYVVDYGDKYVVLSTERPGDDYPAGFKDRLSDYLDILGLGRLRRTKYRLSELENFHIVDTNHLK